MRPGGTFDLADRLTGGKLAELLNGWRTEDPPVTFDEIATRLDSLGITASREKVRRWCAALNEEAA